MHHHHTPQQGQEKKFKIYQLWFLIQGKSLMKPKRSELVPNKAWWRLLFSRNSYTRRRSSPFRQQPRSLTRLRCWTPVMSITSFKNSSCPCLELTDNCLTATSVPSGSTPCTPQASKVPLNSCPYPSQNGLLLGMHSLGAHPCTPWFTWDCAHQIVNLSSNTDYKTSWVSISVVLHWYAFSVKMDTTFIQDDDCVVVTL